MVINLQCEQSNDLAEACQIATKLGNEFHNELRPGDAVSQVAEWGRAKLANAFQILFARTIVANFSKAKVTASTAVSRSLILQRIRRCLFTSYYRTQKGTLMILTR